jgi:hypothetical protein
LRTDQVEQIDQVTTRACVPRQVLRMACRSGAEIL